jgi:hypothetical protein
MTSIIFSTHGHSSACRFQNCQDLGKDMYNKSAGSDHYMGGVLAKILRLPGGRWNTINLKERKVTQKFKYLPETFSRMS